MPAGSLVLLLAAQLEIVGESTCPSPSSVAVALEGLIPADTPSGDEAVDLTATPSGTLVRLRHRDGTVLGERLLDAAASCAEQARAAAVIIAVWHARLSGQPLPATPLAGPSTATNPADLAAAVAAPTRWAWDADLVGFAALATGTGTPGARAGLAQASTSGFVLRASLSYAGPHSQSVGGGTGRWWRAGLAIGAGLRNALPSGWFLESGAEIIGSAVVIRGRGYTEPDGGTTVDPGVALAIRLGKSWKKFGTFGFAGVNWWPRPQRVFVDGAGDAAELPRFEGMAGLGLSWRTGL